MNSTFNIQHFDGLWEKLAPRIREQLLDLDQNHFDRPWPKDSWEQLLVDSGREFQLSTLIINDQVMGFVLFLIEKADQRAHLVKILCHPEVRGRGFGFRMLSVSQQRLVDLYEIGLFDLEVETANEAALGLYRKLGYKIMRELKDLYGTSLHGVAMQAEIQTV